MIFETWQQVFLGVLVLLVFASFVKQWLSPELTALTAWFLCFVTGILSWETTADNYGFGPYGNNFNDPDVQEEIDELNPGGVEGFMQGLGNFYKTVSEKALNLKTGARGIRSVLEQFFIELTYNITDLKAQKVKEIYIDDLDHETISYIKEVDNAEDN